MSMTQIIMSARCEGIIMKKHKLCHRVKFTIYYQHLHEHQQDIHYHTYIVHTGSNKNRSVLYYRKRNDNCIACSVGILIVYTV